MTPADASAGRRSNTATAAGTAPGGGNVQGSDTLTVPITAADPQITVTKAMVANDDANDSGSIDPGDTLTYSIVVSNTGNVVLTDIALEDSLVPIECALPPSLTPGGIGHLHVAAARHPGPSGRRQHREPRAGHRPQPELRCSSPPSTKRWSPPKAAALTPRSTRPSPASTTAGTAGPTSAMSPPSGSPSRTPETSP